MFFLYRAVRKDSKLDFEAFPRRSIERDWGMEYIPAATLDAGRIKEMASSKEDGYDAGR